MAIFAINTKLMRGNMPTAISLFAGAGGCSLGFMDAGFKILYATDIDKKAIETYKRNFPETLAECRDINDIDFNALLKDLNIVPGELDVLLGGPPCQGFSTAGTRFWDDPRNHLLKQYVRALEIVQPKWFMMENVEGLLTTKKGDYIYEAIRAFVNLGYHVRLEKVYIHEYGVPQRRKRVIILGSKSTKDFTFPKPISKSYGQIYRNGKVTIADALYGLPSPSIDNCKLNYANDLDGHWAEILKNPAGTVSDHFSPRIDDLQSKRIKALGVGETMRNLPPELQHASFLKRANRRVKDGTPSEKRGGPPSGLKRLLINEPCLTITSAATREFIHPTENRTLTIRECARIQTFPDKFEFEGNQSDKIRQIGNAIPPLLAYYFALHIKSVGLSIQKGSTVGSLIDFTLTKSSGSSPALKQTEILLNSIKSYHYQVNLFENAN